MKSHLLFAMLALGVTPAFSFAQAGGANQAAAQQALQKYYGNNAKVRIYGNNTVNGVEVFTAAVDQNGKEANATVTAHGDIIDAGTPIEVSQLPPAVSQLVQGLFQNPPTLVNDINGFRYSARMNVNGKPYTADFDATGRILDIREVGEGPAGARASRKNKNNPSLQQEAQGALNRITGKQAQQKTTNQQQPPAANANEEQQVRQQFTQHFAGNTIQNIRPDPDAPGFYIVTSTSNAGPGYAVLNAQGQIPEYRMAIARGELPKPVQQALATLFKPNELVAFERGAERIYRVNETAANNQRIDLWVRGDGDVIAVNEPNAGGQAVPAGARTGPGR